MPLVEKVAELEQISVFEAADRMIKLIVIAHALAVTG
jgi:hypothetical protein